MIFDIIYGLPELINGGLTVRRILQPTFALWYILSLIFWRLFLQLLPQKLIDKKVLMLVTSIVIALAVGFIPVGNELAFQRTFTYWPFFLSGYYIKRDGVIDKIRSCNKWVALSVCAILFVVIYMYVPVMYSHSHYGNIPDDTITRGLQLIMAFCLCFCLMVIGREKLPILTELGKYTLIIYLLHPPIVKLMKVACIKVGHQPNILTSIIITAITIALIYAIKNLKIFKYLR